MTWVYVLGERTGEDIKVGKTSSRTVASRLRGVNSEQTTNASYVLLAAVSGDGKDEQGILDYFGGLVRGDKGRRREYLWPKDEVVEYVAWLRAQWWSSIDPSDDLSVWEAVPSEHWLPSPTRRHARPAEPLGDAPIQQTIISPGQALQGPLAGTAWDWMPDPQVSIQDYFTPLEIVDAAREGMGGIDLDAASHWLANRTLRIPEYFTVGYSAFDNDWSGRVWLNPPYGDNGRWFERALAFIDSGAVGQMCMLSPVWAFTTGIAGRFMARSSVMILLTPTPTFWGNAGGRTGTNQPHAIVYIGERGHDVVRAFTDFGIPMSLGGDGR